MVGYRSVSERVARWELGVTDPAAVDASLVTLAQVPSVSAHVGAAAVRALPQGAGERAVRQVHRRAADPALAALLAEADAPSAGAGRAAAAQQRRREVRAPRATPGPPDADVLLLCREHGLSPAAFVG